jgi:hypothetical protein
MPSVGRSPAVTSLDEDIAEIRGAVLKELDAGRDVMMHAHSWAGVPVCSALEGFSRAERQKEGKAGAVVNLTFVSSFVLQEGVSLQDFIGVYKDAGIKFEVRPASYVSISRSLLIIYPRTETFGWINLFQCCTRISHQKKPKDGSIAGYYTRLRHNDFLPPTSQRYDHSFGFSPTFAPICISNSCNLQNILIPSTTLIINSIMPPISFD